jgi:hypothetical protein
VPNVACRYLVDILFEIGPTMPGAMGNVPLSELEILAWQINRRRMLQPWEISFVRRLSAAFLSMHAEAEDRDCPAPYRGMLERHEAAAVTKSLMADFRAQGS